jgi:L-lactate permease
MPDIIAPIVNLALLVVYLRLIYIPVRSSAFNSIVRQRENAKETQKLSL